MKFLTYNPEQAYLLPPSVREVLGEDQICFFVHQVVERLELSAFEQGYVEEGRPAYHPALLLKRRSETDPDSRFLRDRKGFTLGYTAEVAVSEDHLIVEQRVGQNATDNATLVPLVETVERRCRERPQKVSADSGFFCLETIVELAQRGLDVYVPDWNLARELNRGQRAPGAPAVRHPEHRRMRRKLRDPAGRAVYQRRKAIVEPVIGVLKEQRGMRQFRRRGLEKVAVEFALAATACNLTRLWRNKPKLDQEG